MRRSVVALLLGTVIGSAVTLATISVTGGWYEYHAVDERDVAIRFVNSSGWEIVPSVTDVYLLRRPRFRLP